MGEKHHQPFWVSFNASLKADSQESRATSDGGLILLRELDERLGHFHKWCRPSKRATSSFRGRVFGPRNLHFMADSSADPSLRSG